MKRSPAASIKTHPVTGTARTDRVLIVALIAGALLGGYLLWSHINDRIAAIETIIGGQVRARAAALDGQFQIAGGHLAALRQRAEYFYAEYPAPEDVPRSPLLTALLASNPGDQPDQAYTLNRLPPPYLTEQIGNIIAMSDLDASQQPGISRPDRDIWRQEAAMAVQMLPLMAVTSSLVPDTNRLIYASVSGMVAVHPWIHSDDSDLLLQVVTYPPFRQAAPQMNPGEKQVWTLSQKGPAATAALSLPLSLHGRYFGTFTIELLLEGLKQKLGAVTRSGSQMLLIDGEGTIILRTGSPLEQEPLRLEQLVPDAAERLTADGATRGISEPFLVSAALEQAPWRVVYIVPPLNILVPAMKDVLISVIGFLAALTVVLFVTRRLTQRSLAVRDAAMQAERDARAAAERALTDLRAAHDELDFLNREKTRFFSLISHDLRGPFNSMLGMTQELADHAPRMAPDQTADFARSVHEMARKVFDLLENLLQWSRVQMSGTPFAPAIFPIRDVVAHAIRDVTPTAQAKNIQILDAVGDRWVLADRTMILAVLRNLLMNAVKFSHPDGAVHVTSRATGDRLEVAVTDKGVGMEPDLLAHAMETGPKTSRPGTQGETGTGLGLTLVRDLVLRHGGELILDSAPDQGTVVKFSIPMTANPAETKRLLAAHGGE